MRRVFPTTICTVLLALSAAAPAAQGAASDPLFTLTPTPQPNSPPSPPPTSSFYGPCGLAVDSGGRFFVSDYYHHAIDVYSGSAYSSQLANEDPVDGPCGLAFDSTDHLYVNNFHRNVVKFNASPSFGSGVVIAGANGLNDPNARPTGVAVDVPGNVYVDERTYVAEYDSSGNPVQQIGLGAIGDGYGVAVSQSPGTLGYVYVPDASTNTVKIFDPATSVTVPKAEIKDPFGKPFVSLRDSAIAVDRVSGDVYFADNTQPSYTERPLAIVYVYSSANSYKGHLKYNVIDALPPGLAVDNSTSPTTQGRVYVTSGNTSPASVYAYGPGAATFATPLPPVGFAVSSGGGSSAAGASGDSGSSDSPVPEATPTEGAAAPSTALTAISSAPAHRRAKSQHPRRRRRPKHRVHRHHHRGRHRHA
jgi:hypothetical protein